MSYQFIENIEARHLDEFCRQHMYNNIYQTGSWAHVKKEWTHEYVAVQKDGKTVAAAMILFRPLPMGFTMAYIPRGPLMEIRDPETVKFTLKAIQKFCKKKHAIECKFDPNILIGSFDIEQKEAAQKAKDDELVQILEEAGARHRGYNIDMNEAVQPRFQCCFPIDEQWQQRIPKKTLEKINSSFKKGVQIKVEDDKAAERLAAEIMYTEKRKGIALRNKDYFDNMLKQFKDHAAVLSASLNHELILKQLESRKEELSVQIEQFKERAPKKLKQLTKLLQDTENEIEKVKKQRDEDGNEVIISALLLVHDTRSCELLYSGLNEKYRRYLSAYSLRYKAIEWAFNQGCSRFNFGGVQGTLDDGLFTFKSSFNPKIDVYLGEFDMPCNKILYPVLTKAIQLRKKKQLRKRGKI